MGFQNWSMLAGSLVLLAAAAQFVCIAACAGHPGADRSGFRDLNTKRVFLSATTLSTVFLSFSVWNGAWSGSYNTFEFVLCLSIALLTAVTTWHTITDMNKSVKVGTTIAAACIFVGGFGCLATNQTVSLYFWIPGFIAVGAGIIGCFCVWYNYCHTNFFWCENGDCSVTRDRR